MVFFSVKKASKVTGLTEDKIRKLIRNQKLEAKRDINGCYLIPEFEVKRCLEEKKKVDSGEYLNVDDLDAYHIRRTILYDGTLEVEMLLGQHYVKWGYLKKWVLSKNQEKPPRVENKKAIITMQVLNKRGVHFRPSALICKTCTRYLCTGTICGILHEDGIWIYPIHGIETLLEMAIEFHERIIILCIGVLCDNLLAEIGQSINTEFSLAK